MQMLANFPGTATLLAIEIPQGKQTTVRNIPHRRVKPLKFSQENVGFLVSLQVSNLVNSGNFLI
jgi:hypothetical protein